MSATVFLLIDAQVNMFAPHAVHDGERVLAALQNLLDRTRQAGTAVVFVQHNGGPGEPDEPQTPGWAIHPHLSPAEGEPVVQKSTPNAYYQTNLQDILTDLGARRLIIAGMQTEYCIDTNVRVSHGLGYDVVLAADAHSTFDSPELTAVQIIAHHNSVLKSFAQVIPAAEVDVAWAVPPLPPLAEGFTAADTAVLQTALAQLAQDAITYRHPTYVLYQLRQIWDAAYRPPAFRMAKPEWTMGVTAVFLDQLQRQPAAFKQLVVSEVIDVAQIVMKAVMQNQAETVLALSADQTLWRCQAQSYRLVYHLDPDKRQFTLLSLAANAPQTASMADQFRKRFGHA